VVSLDKADEAKRADLPYLLFLQGGPGFEAARLTETGGWVAAATDQFRVLLLDQRGTGRSTRVSTASVLRRGPNDPAAQATYLSHFRADAIVADAEAIRTALIGENGKWSMLGQSFGGFCITRYLSASPGGIKEAFLTGGLPPLVHEPDAAPRAYRKLLDRVAAQNKKFYRRFPGDAEVVRSVAKFLAQADGGSGRGVKTPSGGRLSLRGLQVLASTLNPKP
jgi:pimeloyl-ACP methyl ester carboxylesterase